MSTSAPDGPAIYAYQVSSDFSWTEKAYEELQEGNDLHGEVVCRGGVMASRVWGKCPRCGDPLDDRQSLTVLTSFMGVRGTDSPQPTDVDVRFAQVDVSCGCGVPHPGAPTGATGCGTSFRVELPIQNR
jgi:hypothetical protein